jgi:hypothetical protein
MRVQLDSRTSIQGVHYVEAKLYDFETRPEIGYGVVHCLLQVLVDFVRDENFIAHADAGSRYVLLSVIRDYMAQKRYLDIMSGDCQHYALIY